MEENLKIEILFPEFCNLYGDLSNMKYLQKCLPKAHFHETAFDEEPIFVKEKVNFIYLGPMTESRQEKVIQKLLPYKQKIEELIEQNVVFLMTGNALEIFSEYIEKEDGSRIQALGIFKIYAKQDMLHRHNSKFIGKWEDIDIIGFKSQFTFSYGQNSEGYFASVEKGIGINKESKLEGIQRKNFIGTYVIGPILILNPYFTKKLIQKMGIEEPKLAFAEDVKKAYEYRLKELQNL